MDDSRLDTVPGSPAAGSPAAGSPAASSPAAGSTDTVGSPASGATATAATAADKAARGRFGPLRHYARSLSLIGMVFGWLFLLLSLTPSLMPRSWQAQGLVTGSALVQGYGLGVVIAWVLKRAGVPRPSDQVIRLMWYTLAILALITIPSVLVLSSLWERPIRVAVAMPGDGFALYLGAFAIAMGVAVAVVGVVRLIHDVYLLAARRLLRVVPAFAARLLAIVGVAALAVGLVTGFADQVMLRLADATFSADNDGNLPGVSRPASPLRSGSPASLVSWRSLGMQGRSFVSTGPTVADIERFTGRPAVQPIRVYVGINSAPTLEDEADLAFRELRRTGAFHRALLAVAVPTGRGSVYPTLADPLEYMYGGNTAIAAIQYSYLPSWLAFVAERRQARESSRALFNTIYDYWSSLPAAHRPRLVVVGESLGALGAEAPFSGVADITTRTSGALFVGPPNDSQVWRELTAARVNGSPQWRPIYGDGRTVRFVTSVSDLRTPSGRWRHPKIVYLQHASDPVVWWSLGLAWHKPDWLAEPRGPDVPSKMQWYPFVTFWQVSADLIVTGTAPGYGHSYGTEAPAAWAAILHPPGWTSAQTAKLTRLAATGRLP